MLVLWRDLTKVISILQIKNPGIRPPAPQAGALPKSYPNSVLKAIRNIYMSSRQSNSYPPASFPFLENKNKYVIVPLTSACSTPSLTELPSVEIK